MWVKALGAWREVELGELGAPPPPPPPPPPRRNLILNPSYEVNGNGWWNWPGTLSAQTTQKFAGTRSARIVAGTQTDVLQIGMGDPVIEAGKPYTFSLYVWSTATYQGKAHIDWKTSGMAPISKIQGPAAPIVASTWTRFAVSGVAPANAGVATVYWESSAYIPKNGQVYFDATMLEQADAAGDYFDGTFPNAVWDGAAHNSSSTWTSP